MTNSGLTMKLSSELEAMNVHQLELRLVELKAVLVRHRIAEVRASIDVLTIEGEIANHVLLLARIQDKLDFPL